MKPPLSQLFKPRVVVPASRVSTGSYASRKFHIHVPRGVICSSRCLSAVYRTAYSQPTCNAVNRLESVTDEKPDIKRVGYDSAQRIYRTADKSRGLRHFSTKVCEKVKEKGRTNYNEVELCLSLICDIRVFRLLTSSSMSISSL